MPINRFYKNTPLEKDQIIAIDFTEFLHLKKVLRKKENDLIEIVNGKGKLAIGIILKIEKDFATIKINSVFEEIFNKKNKIILIQAITSSNKLSLILEKSTELGVDEIIFFTSKNSIKKTISENEEKRLRNIKISSIKQSGRLFLPKTTYIESINDLNNLNGNLFLADLDKNANPLSKELQSIKNNDPIYIFIGPEKGFTKDEINHFSEHLKTKKVKLNENILRTETAAIAAIAIINNYI